MSTLELVPGLTVDHDMFETAAEGSPSTPPHLGFLSWEVFTDPSRWWLIPEEDGLLSKAELTLAKSAEHTAKLNIWFRGDVRDKGRPMPHNHPWDRFVGNVLMGGYTEDRYTEGIGQVDAVLGVEHHARTGNIVRKHVFHEVREIHAPGRTMSLMTCSSGVKGAWGYLDTATGGYVPQSEYQPVADFRALMMALNPQHR